MKQMPSSQFVQDRKTSEVFSPAYCSRSLEADCWLIFPHLFSNWLTLTLAYSFISIKDILKTMVNGDKRLQKQDLLLVNREIFLFKSIDDFEQILTLISHKYMEFGVNLPYLTAFYLYLFSMKN
jgi:hypothetical protein